MPPRRPAASKGAQKSHGPKRKLFHQFSNKMRYEFGKLGLLNKFHDFESFKLACMARGCTHPTEEMFRKYMMLTTNQAKLEWLKNLQK